MGLILPQTIRVRTNARTYKHYKEKGYEFEKCGDIIEVNVLDLPKGSNQMVKVVCDICGREREMWYCTVVNCNKENKLIICGSDSCINRKHEDTCMKKYGVKSPMQCKEIQDKAKNTNLGRYGAENPFGSKEIQDKIKDTWQKNYGENIINPGQAQVVKDKIKDTWQKNYGEDIVNVSQVKEIRDKIESTCEERYGSKSYLSSDDFKNKTKDTWSFNGHEGPCSRQQKYIANLVNGKINEAIVGYWIDIYIEKENIIIEYDGSGHFLNDKMNGNTFPTKESILHEKEREDKIINNGYRMIRFIATKDRIPSDEVILNLFEGFKNSDFKVIRIDFEKGTIEKDYKEKSHHDFGKLRRITKKDLEKFKKQEENTSEN